MSEHGVGGDYLTMKAAFRPATGRKARFVVGRQALGDPGRLVLVGKESRRSAEHRLQRLPQAPRTIEMKDVRQLVHDHEPFPAVVRLQRGIGHRRHEQNRDAAGRKDVREAVRRIDVVRQRDVDDAARRMQLAREQRVRSLGLVRREDCARAIARAKVNAEMLSVERAPGTRRIDLA